MAFSQRRRAVASYHAKRGDCRTPAALAASRALGRSAAAPTGLGSLKLANAMVPAADAAFHFRRLCSGVQFTPGGVTTQSIYDGRRATSDKRAFTLMHGLREDATDSGRILVGRYLRQLEDVGAAGGRRSQRRAHPQALLDGGYRRLFVRDFPSGEKNLAWRELFARWFQHAAFNPIGTTGKRAISISIARDPGSFRAGNFSPIAPCHGAP